MGFLPEDWKGKTDPGTDLQKTGPQDLFKVAAHYRSPLLSVKHFWDEI